MTNFTYKNMKNIRILVNYHFDRCGVINSRSNLQLYIIVLFYFDRHYASYLKYINVFLGSKIYTNVQDNILKYIQILYTS